MKIGIITDSACNLDLDFINKQENLLMAPLMINFDGGFHRDLIEVDYDTVYEKLNQTTVTTSLPSLEDFDNAILKMKSEGYTDIIVITISSNLSGTYNAFDIASKEHEDINIHLYDTKTLSMAEGDLVLKALEGIEKGLFVPRIIADLNQLRYEDSIALFTVETLKYLRNGGRIGKVEGTIGDLLHVKPIIFVNDDGVYDTLAKGFRMNRTLVTMRNIIKDKFPNDIVDITIHYGNNLEKARKLKAKLEVEPFANKISVVQLTPVLGIHTGPEMYALIAKIHKD